MDSLGSKQDLVGVILAAGVGSRLRPLTSQKPKCLVTVAGKAILQYQLDAYVQAGIKDVYIVSGYEANALVEYCKHIKNINIHIIENRDFEITNNMYSLSLVKDLVAGRPFILNNADLVIEPHLIASMVEAVGEDLIATDVADYNDESMKISVSVDGFVTGISKSIEQDKSYGCSIDFYKFSAVSSQELFSRIEKTILSGDKNQWTEVALDVLMREGVLKMLPFDIKDMRWVEVDNYEDLSRADYEFSQFDKTLESIDAVFVDLDGTVYKGSSVIPGGKKFVDRLRSSGKKLFFLSNNSSKSKAQYQERLKGLGIEVSEKDIILSSDGLISYLVSNKIKRTFVVGTKALTSMLSEVGLSVDDQEPEFVILGYDTELTYDKLAQAAKYINKGADVLATHTDMVCPTEEGPIPDVGTLIETLYSTTGKRPSKTFGKPNPQMVEHVLKNEHLSPERTLIIGDRLYTDIELAHRIGAQSVLVLSGETSRNDVEDITLRPTIIVDSLASLV